MTLGYPQAVLGLEGVSKVIAAGWPIRDRDMEWIGRLSRLICLDLSNVWVTREGWGPLAALSELRELDLSCNSTILNSSMDFVCGLINLETLNLSDTNVGDCGLVSLAGLSRLKQLDISGCVNVTQLGISVLRHRLPEIEIVR